ncbi:MAG: hypothetical protein PHQ04_05800 [Opitutaceae bacterium]|nr:hypothetical protein [Opitutaceae bacterium]
MLQLPRKKSDAQPEVIPPWHPNFRNYEQLPDTKVIRTAFFVNTAAIVVAASLVFCVGFREYDIYSLNEQIAEAQSQIDSNAKQNTEALRLSKVFVEEDQKLQEAAAFIRQKFGPTEFIVLLGQVIPKEVAIDLFDLRTNPAGSSSNALAVLRGAIAGSADQASGIAARFIDTLHSHPRLAAAFDQINLTNLAKDPKSGFLTFEIVMRFKTEGKEQKK